MPSDLAEPAIPHGAEPESAIHGPIANRYDLGDRIARGGMGIVYRAHDRQLNRPVAVKVMRSRFMDRPDLLRRFLAEARINGKLQHPGVVPVYEVGTLADTRPFIAMKLIEGQTLSRFLRERKNPADNLAHFLKVFESLCQTVAYAHRQGVIHRDLKPDNIMVGEFGEVQVMDWGLAKFLNPADAIAPTPDGFEAVEKSPYLSGDGTTPAGEYATEATAIRPMGPDEGAGFTTAGEVFGTLPYMPPEQARGEIDRVDRRGDVFALGAILCQILTGQPPYFGAPESLRDQASGGKLFGAYVLLDRCGADQALVLLAKHCLAVDPESRPPDASSLASMVTQCLEGLQDRTRQLEMSRLAAEARLVEAEAREKLARKARQLARMLAVAGVMVAGLLAAWIGYFTKRQVNRASEEPQAQLASPVESTPNVPAPADPAAGLVAAVEQWHNELAAAKGGPDANTATQHYREIFATHGLEILNGDPTEIGGHVKKSATATSVVQALTDWLAITPDAKERHHLAAVLKAADHPVPETWLTALDSGEPQALATIADGPETNVPAIGIAVVARQLGQSNDAEHLLINGVRHYPKDYTLNRQLGSLLRTKGKATEAIPYLSAARGSRPSDAGTNLELGLALADAGRPNEALDALRSAVQADPKLGAAHKRIGDLLMSQGHPDEARASYVAASEINPSDNALQLDIGKAELARGDLDAAHKAFAAAINSPGQAAAGHAGLGEIHRRKWEASKAVAEFRAAVAADAKNVDYRVGLVDALRVANDMTGALKEARAAASALPTSAAAHRVVGDMLHLSGDLTGAAAAYRASIKIDATDVETHQRLAATYDGLKEFKSAATELQAVADLRTKDVKAQLALGRARQKAGDPTAAEAFRRALAIEPTDVTVRQQLGRCLVAFGDETGIEELKTALAALPESADIRAELGNAYLALGQFRAAATTLREAADKFPADSPKREAARSNARTAMRMAALEDRLPQVLSGAVTMSTPAAWAEVGEVCRRTKRYAAAARFYGEAAEGDPKYAAQAATCAALAGFGRGNDAAELSDVARAEWRKTALAIFQKSAEFAKDPVLNPLREPSTIADLTASEREAWRSVWEGR